MRWLDQYERRVWGKRSQNRSNISRIQAGVQALQAALGRRRKKNALGVEKKERMEGEP